MSPTELAFWLCVCGVAYHYVAYPIVIWCASAMFGREPRCPTASVVPTPFVSLLISALNEEDVLVDRIANALSHDYPEDRFELVVVSDGSTDATADIVRSCPDPRVRLIEFASSLGKARVLNAAIPELRGDVVLLSDANTFIEPQVARRMASWFQEPRVGVVVGRLVITDPRTGTNVDSIYWRYENFVKEREAALGALLGANGAIYAFRRTLFTPLPADTLIDDFVLPLLMKLRSDCDLVYDTLSVAHEESPSRLESEFSRRSRIGAGGAASLTVLWPLLSPTHGWIAFTFASHKVLRWLCPFLLVGAFAANLALLGNQIFRVTLACQLLLYSAALVGQFTWGRSLTFRVLRMATLFVGVNLALAVGFWRWLGGPRSATWSRTERPARASEGGDPIHGTAAKSADEIAPDGGAP